MYQNLWFEGKLLKRVQCW